MQAQDIRDRALRVIAYGSAKMMQEFLAEIDPEGYYPKAERHNDLWIHIARVICARKQGTDTGSLIKELAQACKVTDAWFRRQYDIGPSLPNHYSEWLQLAIVLQRYKALYGEPDQADRDRIGEELGTREPPIDWAACDKEQSAKRLQLLWDIDRLVNDPATTDNEKWDAIRALLDTHQLLLQIGTADEVNECDFCGWFDGKHSPTCKVAWAPVPKCYEL